MSWNDKFIKALAVVVAPARFIKQGVNSVKEEIKQEVEVYEDRMKLAVSIGGTLVMFLLFFSVTVAIFINHLTGSTLIGYVSISALYLIIFLVLFFTNKKNL